MNPALKARLHEFGYKPFPCRDSEGYQRHVEGTPCRENGALYINVLDHNPELRNPPHAAITMELCAAVTEGKWVKIELFMLTDEDLLAEGGITEREAALVRAWEALQPR